MATLQAVAPKATAASVKEASVLNAANGVTLIGIGLTLWVIEMRFYGISNSTTFLLTTLAGITDFADGYLARKYDQATRLGSILDRLRDKFYAIAHFVFIYLSYHVLRSKGVEIYLILALLIFVSAFELLLFSMGIWGTIKKLRVEANKWGKRKMFTECLVLFFWAFSKDLDPSGFEIGSTASLTLITVLLLSSVIFNWKSLEGYYASYFGNNGNSDFQKT